MPGELLYYVHHHGDGHRSRAREICRRLSLDVTFVSSLPTPADVATWRPARCAVERRWVTIPWDTGDGVDPSAEAAYPDPTAGGVLHWVPLHHRGLNARHLALLTVIQESRPALLVSDVSVEIAVTARLSGVPVVSVLLPGRRDDPAHRLAFELSCGLLAPWPRPSTLPAWLEPFRDRTRFVGGIGGDEHREHEAASPTGDEPRALGSAPVDRPGRVVVAFGATGLPDELRPLPRTPGWEWAAPVATVDATTWRSTLAAADVVVAHAGLGTVAYLATTRRPAVIIPRPRPYGEQQATAELLQQKGIGSVHRTMPATDAWPHVLAEAAGRPTRQWRSWETHDAAERASAWLTGLL